MHTIPTVENLMFSIHHIDIKRREKNSSPVFLYFFVAWA